MYRTASGQQIVKDSIDALSDDQRLAVRTAMARVAREGLITARHLRGDIYEVRAAADRARFRVLFAQETRFVLLGLHLFQKQSQRTPPHNGPAPSSHLSGV